MPFIMNSKHCPVTDNTDNKGRWDFPYFHVIPHHNPWGHLDGLQIYLRALVAIMLTNPLNHGIVGGEEGCYICQLFSGLRVGSLSPVLRGQMVRKHSL